MATSSSFFSGILGVAGGLLLALGVVTPAHAGMQDHAAMAGAGHDGHSFASIDTDHDGRISRTEFATAHDGKSERFASIDGDGDGFISPQEFDAHHAAMMPAAGDGKDNTKPSDEHAGHH